MSIYMPPGSQVAMHSPAIDLPSTKPTSCVLRSGEATLLGRRLVVNTTTPLSGFSVLATATGAEVYVATNLPNAAVSISEVCESDHELASVHEALKCARLKPNGTLPCVLVVGN
eukprot:PhF_6_TR36926/c0_g1_i1/m.54148